MPGRLVARVIGPPPADTRDVPRRTRGTPGVAPGPAGPALAGVKWKFATRGPVRGSPCRRGRARPLRQRRREPLRARSRRRGRERWRAPLGGAVASTPGGRRRARLRHQPRAAPDALDLATGRERWRFEAGPDLPFDGAGTSGSPRRRSRTAGSSSAAATATSTPSMRTTGRKLWESRDRRPRSAPPPPSPAASVFVGSMDGRVHAVDAATGKALWAFETEGVSIDPKEAGFDRTSSCPRRPSPRISSSSARATPTSTPSIEAPARSAGDSATRSTTWRARPEVSWVLGSPAARERPRPRRQLRRPLLRRAARGHGRGDLAVPDARQRPLFGRRRGRRRLLRLRGRAPLRARRGDGPRALALPHRRRGHLVARGRRRRRLLRKRRRHALRARDRARRPPAPGRAGPSTGRIPATSVVPGRRGAQGLLPRGGLRGSRRRRRRDDASPSRPARRVRSVVVAADALPAGAFARSPRGEPASADISRRAAASSGSRFRRTASSAIRRPERP